MTPTVAVLIATYNGEKYLKEQLDSILSQTYKNLKIYISDDCSDDNTIKIIQGYVADFPEQIFYTINNINVGYVKNFEILIQKCKEPYIALADQDDIWKSKKLEISLEKLKKIENNKPAMVHTDLVMIDNFGDLLQESFLNFRKIKLSQNKSINKIISHNGVMGCTIMFNQQLKHAILPFPKKLDTHDYWIALVNEVVGSRFIINEPLISYRIHENNTSNNMKKIQRKRNFYTKFVNDDALPFISLRKEKVIEELFSRFNEQVNSDQKKIILAFLDYLQQCKNPLGIFYNLLKYNLIREDFAYRVKIFIKLFQHKILIDVNSYCKFTSSKQLKKNVADFLNISSHNWFYCYCKKKKIFYGWGRKKSGQKAVVLAEKCGSSYVLLEDGFIRSFGLGVEESPSFSIVEDGVGIYYDATVPSRLENTLNSDDFDSDTPLMATAREAIALIRKHKISKYNNAPEIAEEFFGDDGKKKVLIIAQTAGDASLIYGLGNVYTTNQMIDAAIVENPDAVIYLKIHPDVLSGKKKSDIDIERVRQRCIIIDQNFNPISLLEHFDTVYTKTSQMGFEALLLGKQCVCFGMPFYAGWGLTDDRVSCDRRNQKLSVEEVFAGAYILYSRYYNPYKQQPSDIIDTIKTIVRYRYIERANSGRLFFFGFSKWKRGFMKPFFVAKTNEIYFCDSLKDALADGFAQGDKAFIWGMKNYSDIVEFCQSRDIHISRVEDGFIRSVSLGSDLTRPYSLIVDNLGIYFDPNRASDLEVILVTYEFDEEIKNRAKNLRSKIISSKFSKYNGFSHKKLSVGAKLDQKVILIPGQVEDDASILLGGFGMTTVKLLQETRTKNPSAYIIFKPHPDVLSGNRVGLKDTNIIIQYCDEMIKEASIDSCLEICDEVHTITSTVGFDALLRGKKVCTYGMPFYAGWGLTSDKFMNTRRSRVLELDELVAGALILYPRYISPKTHKLCEVEVEFDEMIEMQKRYFEVAWFRILIDTKTFMLRKLRRTIEFVLEKVCKR